MTSVSHSERWGGEQALVKHSHALEEACNLEAPGRERTLAGPGPVHGPGPVGGKGISWEECIRYNLKEELEPLR